MNEIDISQLQSGWRFPESGLNNFYLLLYLPIGIIVFLLRIVLGVVILFLGSVLPDTSFTRSVLSLLFCAFFGVVVHSNNNPNKVKQNIIISNCVSPLDHFVVHLVTGCMTPCQLNLPRPIVESLGLKYVSSTSLEDLKKFVQSHIINRRTSVLVQPENKVTNGKAILKFEEWPFNLDRSVQPVCLRVRRPIFHVSITTITSSYCNDLFWYLFSPWTVYNVTFMPVATKTGTDDAEFAQKVRTEMAAELKVDACSYSVSDVLEWEKSYLLEQRRLRMTQNPEIRRMAREVKERFPSVPLNVIYKDLVRTKDVNVTLTNILDGHLRYTPEEVVRDIPAPSVSPRITISDLSASFRRPEERMGSFQERKMQMIANARRRYIEKHGLDALASDNR